MQLNLALSFLRDKFEKQLRAEAIRYAKSVTSPVNLASVCLVMGQTSHIVWPHVKRNTKRTAIFLGPLLALVLLCPSPRH